MSEAEHRPTRIVLVRHGESVVTVNRVVGGPRTCSGLSELGVRQADQLRARLERTGEIDATALVSSAYPRARQTAEAIAPAVGLDVTVIDEFGEHDPGPECDGLTFQEFIDRYGMPDWEGDPYATTFPGGETIAAFHHRVGVALTDLVERHEGGTVVVVCHGGVVDAVIRRTLRTPMTGDFDLHTKNTSLTELVLGRPGRWRLVRYNDAAHLEGLPDETPRMSDG
ncbi:MAG: histidine phosphatase family protein [Ilumatobacter sp.]|nr:histidine phosphatase family protein [Ilumatobacter sp.]